MNSIRKLIFSVILLAASAGAHASDYYLDNLSAGFTSFGGNFVSGSFLDNVHFTLDGPAEGSFGVGALNFTVGHTPILNISNLNLSLIGNDGSNIGSDLDFTVNSLDAGNYILQISGNANGVAGGVYAGGINLSPVPEPGVLGLLVAGLAILGFMIYRRRETY